MCVAIAAPVFAGEYQTGSDRILRCTKYGRSRLAITKICASGSIFVTVFVLGMTIHLLILDLAFGMGCLKSSLQMLFSVINLPDINLGQLQVILALAGLLSMLASVSFTFNYLHIGEMSFWTPYVILTAAAVEVPVFFVSRGSFLL